MAIKTLVLAGGQIHDFKAVGGAAKAILEGAGDFEVTHVEEDLDALVAPNLDPYDVVVFHWTVGEITDAQLNGLSNFIAAGKGYVGIHSAADSFRECPGYRALVGGHFITHPAYREYQVSMVDQEHPIIDGLPEEFCVTDEQYIVDYDARVNVLASALWKGTAMPVAWTKAWGKGNIFYLALGHDGPSCENDVFKEMLIRGTRWAATPPAEE